MNRRCRISAVLLGLYVAGMTALGVAELASGYLLGGVTALAAAVLAVPFGVLAWVNQRTLDLNRTLIAENRRLRAERESGAVYLMPRPRHAAEEHDEPGGDG